MAVESGNSGGPNRARAAWEARWKGLQEQTYKRWRDEAEAQLGREYRAQTAWGQRLSGLAGQQRQAQTAGWEGRPWLPTIWKEPTPTTGMTPYSETPFLQRAGQAVGAALLGAPAAAWSKLPAPAERMKQARQGVITAMPLSEAGEKMLGEIPVYEAPWDQKLGYSSPYGPSWITLGKEWPGYSTQSQTLGYELGHHAFASLSPEEQKQFWQAIQQEAAAAPGASQERAAYLTSPAFEQRIRDNLPLPGLTMTPWIMATEAYTDYASEWARQGWPVPERLERFYPWLQMRQWQPAPEGKRVGSNNHR